MTHEVVSVTQILPIIVGSMVQVAIAAWLYHVAPRDPRHVTFGLMLVFSSTWDMTWSSAMTSSSVATVYALDRLSYYLAIAYAAATVAFLLHYPKARGSERARRAALAATATLAFLMLYVHATTPGLDTWVADNITAVSELVLVLGAIVLLAEAWRSRATASSASIILVAVGFLIYAPVGDALDSILVGDLRAVVDETPANLFQNVVLAPMALVLLGVSLLMARRHPHIGPRGSTMLLVLVVLAITGHILNERTVLGWGFIPILFSVLIAYALVRHQLLDVDVRLRWGISKSTVAAVFIAVFFIASEAAQEFFGSTLQSEYVGILATGGLVFVMAPLNRAADRLAEKAVPSTDLGPHTSGPQPGSFESVYRSALRAAMRDGSLTRREELHLAEVAEQLGIGPRRALEMRAEVEEETD